MKKEKCAPVTSRLKSNNEISLYVAGLNSPFNYVGPVFLKQIAKKIEATTLDRAKV